RSWSRTPLRIDAVGQTPGATTARRHYQRRDSRAAKSWPAWQTAGGKYKRMLAWVPAFAGMTLASGNALKVSWSGADAPREGRKTLRHQFHGEQAVGVGGAGQGDLAARNLAEAEAAVVGLVADQDDEADAGGAGGLQRLADQPAPEAAV